MIWLGLEQFNENALYLDVHHIEQNREGAGSRFLLSATLGDGCNEGEVLVELGVREGVTFADMLSDSGLPSLLHTHGQAELQNAILNACRPLITGAGRRIDRRHVAGMADPQLHLFGRVEGLSVAEEGPVWHCQR